MVNHKGQVLKGSNTTWNWKVLLADNDPAFDKAEHPELDGVLFDGHQIETFSSHDYESTRLFLKANPDTALIVMGTFKNEPNIDYQIIDLIRKKYQNLSLIHI